MTVPSWRLDGHVAMVTGAASGIGRSIAIGLAESGARVACCDQSSSDLPGVLKEIEAVNGEGMAVVADVTDAEAVTSAVRQIEKQLGVLSLAVNSAGIANAAPAEEMALPQWQRVFDVDVTGVFLSCQEKAKSMFKAGRGSIVNIASMWGTIVNRGILQAHYNASKAAVVHLSKSVAMEWAYRNIRVNSISPGYTATPMNYRPEVAEQVKKFEADRPLGRMARPEEMVGPAIFLLCEASSFWHRDRPPRRRWLHVLVTVRPN